MTTSLSIHNHKHGDIWYILSLDLGDNRYHLDIYPDEKTRNICFDKVRKINNRIICYMTPTGENLRGKCYGI